MHNTTHIPWTGLAALTKGLLEVIEQADADAGHSPVSEYEFTQMRLMAHQINDGLHDTHDTGCCAPDMQIVELSRRTTTQAIALDQIRQHATVAYLADDITDTAWLAIMCASGLTETAARTAADQLATQARRAS